MGDLFLWWVVIEVFGFVALPLTFRLFAPTSSFGYPSAKIFGLLLYTYLAWLFGYVIPMNAAVVASILVIVGASAVSAFMGGQELVKWLREGGVTRILRTDILFAIGYLFFAWHRSFNPDIFQQEKYMDFAFYNSLIREDAMPPGDPWMSGLTLNYYYFGYMMCALVARIVPIVPNVSYNLWVATIAGLAFSQASMVVMHVTRRWGLAILGGSMCVLLGNLDGFLQFVSTGTVRGMNFWRSSRILDGDNTINEFPLFSSIHGDLHPHFITLPVSLFFLAVLLDERMFPSRAADQPTGYRRYVSYLFAAWVFGALVAVSTWELPMGALVFVLLAGRWQPLFPLITKDRIQLAIVTGVVVVLARVVFFLPSFLGVELSAGGVGVKFATTSVAEFLTINGGLLFAPALLVAVRGWHRLPGGVEMRHLAAAAVAFVLAASLIGQNAVFPLLLILILAALAVAYFDAADEERGVFLLIAAACVALFVCEIVYIKDAYGERLYRMNTVFKFYFQAWILLSIAAPWSIARLLERKWSWEPMPRFVQVATAILVFCSACYPIGLSLDRMGRSPTLDGNRYLESPEFADDYGAIRWIRENVQGLPVILEATGNPYSYLSRFASNTGLPTVMGWSNHEGLWRAHEPRVGERFQQVHQMYNAPTLAEANALLDRFEVEYVVVGELERKAYKPEGLKKFESLEVVHRSGGTTIYRRAKST